MFVCPSCPEMRHPRVLAKVVASEVCKGASMFNGLPLLGSASHCIT